MEVPRLAEVEGWGDAFAKNRWEEYYAENEKRWRERGQRQSEQDEIDEAELWVQMKLEDSLRKEVTKDIEKYQATLMEDWHNRQKVQQRIGLILSRFSPAATYQLGFPKACASSPTRGLDGRVRRQGEDPPNLPKTCQAKQRRWSQYVSTFSQDLTVLVGTTYPALVITRLPQVRRGGTG